MKVPLGPAPGDKVILVDPFACVVGCSSCATICKPRAITFPPRSGDDIYVLYTGGTTGFPKGVVWRQSDVIMVLGGGIDMHTQEPIATPELMADRCLNPAFFTPRTKPDM